MLRSRWARGRLAAWLVLIAGPGQAAEADLQLGVVINGRDTGLIGEFRDRDGALSVTPVELLELGLRVPPGLAPGPDGRVPLASLPGLRAVVEARTQRLLLTAEQGALRPLVLGGGDGAAPPPIGRAGWGGLLNYDVLAQQVDRDRFAGGLFEARLFGPYGVLSSGFLGSAGMSPATPSSTSAAVRLETTYTWSNPDRLERLRVGDFIGSGMAWTRPVRLGGAQFGTAFALRPDLVTFPTPVLRGSAAVGSTVDLLVNGVRQSSSRVPPGPFEFRQPLVVTGAGEAAVVVRDALGRETVQRLSFYASSALLRPGLADYAVQVGAIRRDFGLRGDAYGDLAAVGTLRYGLSEWATLEGHAEAGAGTTVAGGGATVRLGALGVGALALAGSSGEGGGGGLVSLSWERVARWVTVAGAATASSPGYRDLAGAVDGTSLRRSLRLSASASLGDFGNLGLAYVDQRFGRNPRRSRPGFDEASRRLDSAFLPFSDTSILSATWSLPIGERAFAYATAFRDLEERGQYGAVVGLVFTLGPRSSVGASVTRDADQAGGTVQYQRNATNPGDWGWRVQAGRDRVDRAAVELTHQSSWGRVTGEVDHTNGATSGRLGASGAVSTLGGGVFLSERIEDAFAVVRSGGVGDVPVFYENRPAGRTDAAGRRLVPNLRAYEPNTLALDPAAMPLDADTGALRRRVVPPDRAGIVVDFNVRRGGSARLLVVEADGRPVPVGSDILLSGGRARAPVGHDGETHLGGLSATNEAVVTRPDASRCTLRFAFVPVPNDLPTLGPLTCR